ncbi:sensor histidine kinase [Botryobacter ruber]|uniref:sensor histidine kinase n=1 Tax=Botryobacter ruber TaxID=2171629 RepID=UPI000E0A443D|nr:HAMP domain-containing sensor histidine kinase [Botryobacter ruber]
MRTYLLLLLLLLIFQTGTLRAQQKQVPTLVNELSRATTDSARAAIYCLLSGQYLTLDQEKAVQYGQKALQLAKQAEAGAEIAASARLLEDIYVDMNDFRLAYKYQAIRADQEQKISKELEEAKLAALAAAYNAEKKELEKVKQQALNEKKALETEQKLLAYTLAILSAFALTTLLLVFFVFRRRLNAANRELRDARQQLHARNYKIQMQSEELEQQSVAFQQQNEQLARHNNFKNKIFSIISHDLRSPFASVKGVLNLVQNKPMSETGIKYLFGLLSKDLDVTLNMLNNLLVWSKAQLEGSAIKYQPVNMQRLTQENIELACLQANHKNIQVTNLVDAGVFVLADKERVNFVLRNLIMNALKFTFEGGEITVTAKELGDAVTIAVRDNGKGISEENLSRLFTDERFTTIGTSSEKGTGLGLMLCKEFIESMNGRIGVESEEGQGSTFYFTLQKAIVHTTEDEEVLKRLRLA